jgi:hypothetical protein
VHQELNSSRFGVPARAAVRDIVTRPVVVAAVTAPETAAGAAVVWPDRYSAATPATCGVAIDVPLIVLVAVGPVCQALVIATPGANRSTQEP